MGNTQATENRIARKRAKKERKLSLISSHDKIFVTALEEYVSDEQKFRSEIGIHEDIKKAVFQRARKLMDVRYWSGLRCLSRESLNWIREVKDWKPKGKSPRALFRSLTKHLLVKYTMPEFLYSVLEDTYDNGFGKELFLHLGKGGSLYNLVKTGQFPVPLTKRMCHLFMQSPAKFGFIQAIRHAQVIAFGGDRYLAESLGQATQISSVMNSYEELFWSSTIQWSCNQPMLDPAQLGPLYDWIWNEHRLDKNFTMKGRTGVSALRAVEEWHGRLAQGRRESHSEEIYAPSGLNPRVFERKVRLPSGEDYVVEDHILEIGSFKELAAEGRVLCHCVVSYSDMVRKGKVSIWSYRINGLRSLTIEVRNRDRLVVQVRGKFNRIPTQSEMAQIKLWMRENSLSKASWVLVS